jgi:hypothetical protein
MSVHLVYALRGLGTTAGKTVFFLLGKGVAAMLAPLPDPFEKR